MSHQAKTFKSRADILYISIIGMSEPLGKSQVLEYLKALSLDFTISLHSFEKTISQKEISALQKIMDEHGILWTYQNYSNRFGIFSTLFQIVSAFFSLLLIIKNKKIDIVHARSLIPVCIALLLKLLTGVKIIFDIRGFQTDEKAEVGRIKHGGILYKILKAIEKFAYQQSDAIVSLTHNAKSIIGTLTDERKITVIPTCANSEVFKVCDKTGLKNKYAYAETDRIFIHVGTVGNWYDFDAELKLIKQLMKLDETIKLLILNKSEHQLISKKLQEYKIPENKFRLIEADFYTVYNYLNIAEAALFIIKPSYSKKASAPTKFAENLCCELFSITNDDIGDMDYYIKKFPEVGYSFSIAEIDKNLEALSKNILERLASRNKKSQQFKQLFEESMSNTIAVRKYSEIYNKLAKGV